MVQGYYTLQEAAEFLEVSPDELKQMAQKKEVRSFQDRGSLRFRIQDIQELGRRRGTASDPDLVIGEAQPATPRVGPRSPASPRSPAKKEAAAPADDIFDFSLHSDEAVGIGKEVLADLSAEPKKSDPKHSSPTPGRKSAARSPHPLPGSSSDVRLVADEAQPGSDSDVKLIGQDSDVKLSDPVAKTPRIAKKPPAAAGSPTPKKSSGVSAPQPDSGPKKHSPRTPVAAQPADSGVRLVPMDSDSDVKIVGAGSDEVALGASPPASGTDSDVRLERHSQQIGDSGEGEMVLTEEINLDEEIRLKEVALQPPAGKLKPKSKVKFGTTSPLDVSESDADKPSATRPKSGAKPKSDSKKQSPADSSDFDLTPAGDSSSDLLKPDSSSDFSLELPDDSALGGEQSALTGPSSGISLDNPVDAGISLEEGSPAASDADFDLSLEVEATPKPAPAHGPDDSDSEFELSLDPDDSATQAIAPSPADSDSEFELTLDDSGGLSPMEADDSSMPQLKADSAEKDIFETDFEVPALEDDSGSDVAALDTEDSSDFDIALDDSALEDESASQVVALDEEADDSSATRAQEDGVQVEETGEFGDLEAAAAEEEALAEADVDDVKTVVRDRYVQPAPWGALPVVFMLPCVIIMVLVGILGFELVQTGGGYKAPGFLTKAVGDVIGQKIK